MAKMDTELENEVLDGEFDEELEAEIEEEDHQQEKDKDEKVDSGDDTASTSNAEWDRDRQMIEFERSNARRAREELTTLSTAYEQSNQQIEQLKAELEEIKQDKKAETQKLEEMDPDMVDDKVANNIRLVNQRLSEKEQQIDQMAKKIDAYEKLQAEAQAKSANEQAKIDVYTTVEEFLDDMGVKGAAKFRNAAAKLADDLVDSGEKSQPQTFKQAVKLMRECYLQVKDSKTSRNSVSVDTGKGGAGASGKKAGGIKPGKIEDVRAQMLKDQSWLKD
jgi:chromosome segregation ATPase